MFRVLGMLMLRVGECAPIYIGFSFIKIIISQIIDYSSSDNQKSAFTGLADNADLQNPQLAMLFTLKLFVSG